MATDDWMAASMLAELRAQVPGLTLTRTTQPERPVMTSARELRFRGLAYPLRLDTAAAVASGLYQLAGRLTKQERAVVQWIIGPSNDRRVQPPEVLDPLTALGFKEPLTPAGEAQLWKAKIAEPLFGVRGRIGVEVDDPARADTLLRGLQTGLWLAAGPHSPLTHSRQSARTARRLHLVAGRGRSWSSLVNAAELAVLLGWPVDGALPPNQALGLAAPPTGLLSDDDQPDARALGRALHPSAAGRSVTLPVNAALSHSHVIGPTGAGKSTLLTQLILADAAAGRSVLLVEPKGDLVRDVLARLPEDRHDDVVVIEPGEQSAVVGLNPLAGPAIEAERRADELLGLFRELFGSAIGPRSADVLLHALITAARLDGGTLIDVPALLTRADFRRRVLPGVSDPLVLAPFWAGFEAYSDTQRQTVIAPIQNKLRAITARSALRRMLGQPVPAFALDELFARPHIVLINLNKGLIGPETTRLLGALVLQQLWRTIQRRAATPAKDRAPVMVVVDEWQDFVAALDFADVLSTSRGLGVGWTLAHQHLGQLSSDLRAAVLANARNRVAFRPAQADQRDLAAVLGSGVGTAELDELAAYQAVARVQVGGALSDAFAVQTVPPPAPRFSPVRLSRASLARYGVAGADVDDQIQARWQPPKSTTDSPIGSRRRPS
ncbi:type IV secretory system conjugative DNA transfer family protein [Pseudonocardia nematodicida]|uniref:Type IV secretory system conjugative DNA transfer family protein n=1 Tax=Pseudonocardia nematodicida TaxID=1206997 RepID=A0ABV1KBB5_9PSEU